MSLWLGLWGVGGKCLAFGVICAPARRRCHIDRLYELGWAAHRSARMIQIRNAVLCRCLLKFWMLFQKRPHADEGLDLPHKSRVQTTHQILAKNGPHHITHSFGSILMEGR